MNTRAFCFNLPTEYVGRTSHRFVAVSAARVMRVVKAYMYGLIVEIELKKRVEHVEHNRF